jgi:tripartite-type tricarboxylate transporter receptor subunit TctC
MLFVNYKGGEAALIAVMTGEADLMFPTAGNAATLLKAGKLKPLAISFPQRSPLFPGLPTVSESGLPGYEAASRIAMFAPAKTPATIIAKLNQEAAQALGRPEVKERFRDSGIETVGNSPEQLLTDVKGEMARIGKVVREGGLKIE